ncbi:MAG: COX15/CtaA family protein [Acidobacteria bacterium]|nr:COX15/CtaA family protein [Acidobacteriota bacterium]
MTSVIPRAARARDPLPFDPAMAGWLLTCAALVLLIVVVGGFTRLTHSGLSIVEWAPVTGVVPPLTGAQWQDAFEQYRQTPEYQKVNRGMSLEAFKGIYWVEWAHRLLGRLVGLVFFLPAVYWWARGRVPRSLVPRLAGLFALGGLQGVVGWYMVASGLVDVPRVSPYRLAAHLLLAAVVFAGLVWTALDLLRPEPAPGRPVSDRMRHLANAVVVVVLMVIVSGAFVAGTRAGFAFNTFPLMGGRWIPEGLFAVRPLWTNLFENPVTVQFGHRLLALALSLLVLLLWWQLTRRWRPAATRAAASLLLGGLVLQVALGVSTLLYVVPTRLAVTHQGNAFVLLGLALLVRHRVRPAGRREGI